VGWSGNQRVLLGGVAKNVEDQMEQIMTDRFATARLAAARGACVLSSVLTLAATAAPNYPKEGKYDYTTCYSGTTTAIQVSKTTSANTIKFIGNTRSNPPGGPFDMLAFTCVGMGSSNEGKSGSAYFCQVVDTDGDRFMAHGVFDGAKTVTDAFGGTGKYEGMVRNGTSESPGPYPTAEPGTFTGCNRQTGTYKMK
jgi:hypothetical protein